MVQSGCFVCEVCNQYDVVLFGFCESITYKMWEPRRLTTLWASTAC
jgi:hypothetical protein